MYHLKMLSIQERVIYALTVQFYTITYYCFECHTDYDIAGAFPRRFYFCPDCRMELLKGSG